jgi:hypothetical protein
MSLQQVKDHRELVRDTESGAIINVDRSAYLNALERHNKIEKQKKIIENNTNDINSIKSEISEIKTMLKTLLTEGKDHG